MFRQLLIGLALALSTGGANAEMPSIAPEDSPVQLEFERFAASCSGNPEHVQQMSLLWQGVFPDENDGFTVVLINVGNGFTGQLVGTPCSCDEAGEIWCGNCGTQATIWVEGTDGVTQRASSLCIRGARQTEYQGRPALMVGRHGASCYEIGAKGGASPCYELLQFSGYELESVAKSLDQTNWVELR
ncbi:hypothetical protein [Octadecabacter sp. R77987]|uniref:hypothetical protein n=1 Tax=Octadecabacter sp. R77987 TaxID=3093874 RepID=UPI00366E9930